MAPDSKRRKIDEGDDGDDGDEGDDGDDGDFAQYGVVATLKDLATLYKALYRAILKAVDKLQAVNNSAGVIIIGIILTLQGLAKLAEGAAGLINALADEIPKPEPQPAAPRTPPSTPRQSKSDGNMSMTTDSKTGATDGSGITRTKMTAPQLHFLRVLGLGKGVGTTNRKIFHNLAYSWDRLSARKKKQLGYEAALHNLNM